MFEQLQACLNPNKSLSEEETGRVLDQLRRLPYFYDLNSFFGADYLVLMIPLLQLYVLREGLTLMGDNCQYVLLQGDLRELEEQFEANRTIEHNRLFELRDKVGVRFVAQSDCKIIKIRRGASAGLVHFQKKLHQKERERNQEIAKLRKLIKGKQNKEKLEFLKAIEFFSNLGEYDLFDLTVQSQIKEYSQGSLTHNCGQEVQAIGCVLSGKVKLSFPTNLQAKRDQAVSLFLAEGEWLGLEEYLWESNFKSNGEAASISAIVVWIPRDVFRSKFNLKTNYFTMSRLISVIETKKALFQRSLDSRRRKDMDLVAQGQALRGMNQRLLEKISAMVVHQQKRKNFRKAKPVQQIELPDHLIHRSYLATAPPNLLPKIFERVNLFPEEYQHTAVSITQLREMQRLAQIVKRQHAQHKEFHQFAQQNPEAIYKTILNQIPRNHEAGTTNTTRFIKTVRDSRSGAHTNSSIYNNFRVSKSQPKKEALLKSKTLHILP